MRSDEGGGEQKRKSWIIIKNGLSNINKNTILQGKLSRKKERELNKTVTKQNNLWRYSRNKIDSYGIIHVLYYSVTVSKVLY